MPTVLIIGPYRIGFYSKENQEPPHVHVKRDRCNAKFWLEPVKLARYRGFGDRELNIIRELVEANRQTCLEEWHAHFRHKSGDR